LISRGRERFFGLEGGVGGAMVGGGRDQRLTERGSFLVNGKTRGVGGSVFQGGG